MVYFWINGETRTGFSESVGLEGIMTQLVPHLHNYIVKYHVITILTIITMMVMCDPPVYFETIFVLISFYIFLTHQVNLICLAGIHKTNSSQLTFFWTELFMFMKLNAVNVYI